MFVSLLFSNWHWPGVISEEHALTSTEYIKHHLTNMAKCQMVHGNWLRLLKKLGVHCNSLGFNGLVNWPWFCLLFWMVAKTAKAGVPTNLQLKWSLSLLTQVSVILQITFNRSTCTHYFRVDFHLMDLIPVDWIPQVAAFITYLVWTLTTFTSRSFHLQHYPWYVFICICTYLVLQQKGVGGFVGELALNPFNPQLQKRCLFQWTWFWNW